MCIPYEVSPRRFQEHDGDYYYALMDVRNLKKKIFERKKIHGRFHCSLVLRVQLKVSVRWTTVSIEREIVIGTIPMHFAGVPSVPAPSGSPTSVSSPSAPPLEPPPYSERKWYRE